MAWADEAANIPDWLNLPSSASTLSLWDSLHDAEVVSIRSDLLDRTMVLLCEIEHLREFYSFPDGFRFVLHLGGVQSARVLGYAIWPGESPSLDGLSYEEQNRAVSEYQAKWREESKSWNDFESGITRENEQVFSISDAAVAMAVAGPVALKLCGHVNYATYHEAFLRFDKLEISGSDGKNYELDEFRRLGEGYWETRSARMNST